MVKTSIIPARDTIAAPGARLFLVIENRLLREAVPVLWRKQFDRRFHPLPGNYIHPRHRIRLQHLVSRSGLCSLVSLESYERFLPAVPARKVILLGMDDEAELFSRAVRSGVGD